MGQLASPNVLSNKEKSSPIECQSVTKRERFGTQKQSLYSSPFTSYRYHAHSEVQRGDGLYGGLVVHNPTNLENITYQYDHELLFLVGDWYHWQANKVLTTFMSYTGTGLEVRR